MYKLFVVNEINKIWCFTIAYKMMKIIFTVVLIALKYKQKVNFGIKM